MPSAANAMYPAGPKKDLGNMAQAQTDSGFPSLNREDVVPLWSKQRDYSKVDAYEEKTAKDLETKLRTLGDGFFRKQSKGAQEFLKKPPGDIEIYHVPMDAFEGGDKYKPSDQLLYMKVLPKVS